MNKFLWIYIFFLFLSGSLYPQFRNETSNKFPSGFGIYNGESSFLKNFNMRHNYSFSYSTFGKNAFAIQSYTNTISFNLSDNIAFEMDASIINSPYSTFGKNFSNNINGLYITRAQLNYRISENSSFQFQFNNNPFFLLRDNNSRYWLFNNFNDIYP